MLGYPIMSKSYQKNQKLKSQSAPEEIRPIQIDETIQTGQVIRQQEDFSQDMIDSMTNVFEQMEELGLLNPAEFMSEMGEIDLDEFKAKIQNILGTKNLEVNSKKLNRYLKFLKQEIQMPCYLTGNEEFMWEEDYLFGDGSQKEYENLKKTKPSYTDVFVLMQFAEKTSELDGVLVEVQRVSDQKIFILPLADLEITDENTPNYELVEDYSMWFLNYM